MKNSTATPKATAKAPKTRVRAAAINPDRPKVVLRPDHSRYTAHSDTKTASGKPIYDCADAVANLLRGKDLDEIYEITGKALKAAGRDLTIADLQAKYAKLNLGMQRMNLSNILRGLMRVDGSMVAVKVTKPKAKAPKAAKAAAKADRPKTVRAKTPKAPKQAKPEVDLAAEGQA